MRFVALIALASFTVAFGSGCGGDDTPPITGPVVMVVATEPHGGSFRAWFEGLTNGDFAQLTTTDPIQIKLTGFADSSRNEVYATLDASYTRGSGTARMTLEVENHKEMRLRVDGLAEIIVKETTAGNKVVSPDDPIAPGKHTFQVTAKLPD
jgi:hypothetical protein